MSAQPDVESASMTDAHEGGFRPTFDISTERGGPDYGEFVGQVREFMDRVRAALPTAELTDELLDQLRGMNEKLAAVETDEWTSPAGTRIDLPARGNITLPPYDVVDAGPTGVDATITFTRFNLGGNGAAHGGFVALLFDDLGGMAGALNIQGICRTAYLKVDYRSLTPLDRELKVHCWVDRVERRKVFVRGTLHEGDRLCAEMDALFIQLKPGQP
ncbi:PaaI family thioesterase [Gordonia sp. CPCC 205333]|uniref:PaaI family thioesterase n=1 Tax=Gordonia sp. CPCC 205333 TaxID=3140790 RepID=UPI003AF36655